jgi:hypothetical protein
MLVTDSFCYLKAPREVAICTLSYVVNGIRVDDLVCCFRRSLPSFIDYVSAVSAMCS